MNEQKGKAIARGLSMKNWFVKVLLKVVRWPTTLAYCTIIHANSISNIGRDRPANVN